MTAQTDEEHIHDVDPDRDSPAGVIGDCELLGRWLRVVDCYGNGLWFRSLEHVVTGCWLVAYETDDKAHMVSRDRVENRVSGRWPDVSVHRTGPEGTDE